MVVLLVDCWLIEWCGVVSYILSEWVRWRDQGIDTYLWRVYSGQKSCHAHARLTTDGDRNSFGAAVQKERMMGNLGFD